MIIACTPAMADALSVIFRKEDIPYSHGMGPGCIAIEVKAKDVKRAHAAINEWQYAINVIHAQIATQKGNEK